MLKTLAAAGLLGLAALPWVRNGLLANSTTVLMYHDLCEDGDDIEAWVSVRRADFVKQLAHLRRHYEIVSLDDALAARASPRPRPLAVLTFDDGLAGNHDVLLPIVEAERVPVTIYVATAHLEHGHLYWFDRLVNAVQTTEPIALDLSSFGLGIYRCNRQRGPRNWAVIQRLLTDLKTLAPDRRMTIVAHIETSITSGMRSGVSGLRPLTLTGLQRLASSRYVTIGAHSHCHSLLTQLSIDAAGESIERSRVLLRQWTGQAIEHFAYPSGAYNDAIAKLVQDLGFRTAVTTENNLWHPRSPLMRIPRIAVGRYDGGRIFQVNLLGGLRNFGRLASQ